MRSNGYQVTSRAVLFFIAANPGISAREIGERMSLSRSAVSSLLADLKRLEMLHTRYRGRRLHYTVNPDAPLLFHPVLRSLGIHTILRRLMTVATPELARISVALAEPGPSRRRQGHRA